MTLQKNFIKPSIDALPIPKWQWLLNIFVHIGLALMFYLFLIYSTELLKFVYNQPTDTFFIRMKYTSQPNSFFIKIMVAFFSILFAEAFLIQSIFSKTSILKWHNTLKKRHRTKIFDDYRLILFMAFILFFKLVILNIYLNTSVHFSLSEEKKWILQTTLILLNVVLYLQLWVYLRYYFSNTFKWVIRVFIINGLFALIFAVIPLNNLDKYYHNLSENAIDTNYDIDFVKAKNGERVFHKSSTINAFLAYPKNHEKTEPILVFDHKNTDTILDYHEVQAFLDSAKKSIPHIERLIYKVNLQIAIGLDVEMKYVYKLHNELKKAGILRVDYSANFDDLNNGYHFNFFLKETLPHMCYPIYKGIDHQDINDFLKNNDTDTDTDFLKYFGCELIKNSASFDKENTKNNRLTINSNKISLNEESIIIENLSFKLIELLKSNEPIILEIRIDDDAYFKEYIKTIDALKNVRKHLHKKYAQEIFQTNFENLDASQRKQIITKSYNHFTYIKFNPREWEYYDYLKQFNFK